ncbi:YpmS family protein [Bacillus mesophilum]|uniref:YpmS family protein n=1 Tax=Bacillus mesophilum TaxID=1071718 RepID=A0A7V7RMI7_9BACI|nr:YpmS family protein [Bacillus mesophilum]KAB2333570.1 YpmS family protein [Bacillus mesophilum]
MKKNKWKLFFFVLLGLNLALFVLLAVLIYTPTEHQAYEPKELNESAYAPFSISANKQDLNGVINHYLESEGMTGAFDYQIFLNDDVELIGSLPVFTQEIQMKLAFEPTALENGDIVLEKKEMSVGQLQLPASYVMKFVKDNYDIPEWVEIVPSEERIYVALTDMKLKSDVKVKVNEFDLEQDDIRFSLLVPVQ